MSGHSKWAQIKRSKGAADVKRGVVFSRLAKKISLAAKEGNSGDPALNFKLRIAIDTAKAFSLQNDNIDRAIKKGLGLDGSAAIEEVLYEGYGPFGTAFIVEAATDNKNRTVSSVKHSLTKAGGNLGSQGSVAWQFSTHGQILVEATNNLDELTLVAIDAGSTDIEESDDGLAITTTPENLETVKEALVAAGATIAEAEIVKTSSQPVSLSEDERAKVEQLYNELEQNEDVTAVYTNAIL
jgi:YebC/PmpR family DNA-binding regulatory protein